MAAATGRPSTVPKAVITPSAAVGFAGSSSSGSRPSAEASIPSSWTEPGSNSSSSRCRASSFPRPCWRSTRWAPPISAFCALSRRSRSRASFIPMRAHVTRPSYSWGPPSTPMSERPLRIVSYNVRYFGHALRGLATTRTSLERIGQKLTSLTPLADVICLQEVETRSLRSTLAFRGTNTQLEAVMAAFEAAFARSKLVFPYDAFHFRAHSYQFRSTTLYTTGLAVIVNRNRLRVEGHNVLTPHAITHHHVARLKDTKQSRICAHVRLATPEGQGFHVFNTHLSLPTPFTREFWS